MRKWKDKIALKVWQVVLVAVSVVLIFALMLGVLIWQHCEIKKILPTYKIQSLNLEEDGYGMIYTPSKGPQSSWTGLSRNFTEEIMDVLNTVEFRECGGLDFYIDKEFKTKYMPWHAGFSYVTNNGTKYSMLMRENYFIFACNNQCVGYYTMQNYSEFKRWIHLLELWILRPEENPPAPPACFDHR